jgi:hypothetical protein
MKPTPGFSLEELIRTRQFPYAQLVHGRLPKHNQTVCFRYTPGQDWLIQNTLIKSFSGIHFATI